MLLYAQRQSLGSCLVAPSADLNLRRSHGKVKKRILTDHSLTLASEGENRAVHVSCSAFDARPSGLGGRYVERAPYTRIMPKQHVMALDALQQALGRLARFLVDNERLFVVAASTMIMSLSHTALRPVLPVFAKGFGVGAAAVGTTVSVYAFARLMMNVPAGMLADKHGRKPLLVWGPAITALGMIGCGMSGTFQELLVWRWVTGLGSALQMAGAQLFLADISLRSNRARTLGTNQAASLLGGLVGPAMGGFLADAVGIRAPFTLTGAAALLAALYGLIRLPETRGTKKDNAPVEAAAAPTVGRVVAAAAVGPDQSRSQGEASTSSRTDAELEAASPQLAQRMRSKRRLAWPAWRQLLASRDFRAIALVNAVMFATANGGRSVLMPLLAVQSFGLKTTFLGLMFAGMAVISLIGVMPAALVADQLGRKWTIVPSCLGLALALVLMALSGRPESFLVAASVYAISNACIGATPAAYAADVMPSDVSGLGLGIYRCAGDIGLMLGPALLGWIADLTTVQTAMVVNAAILAATVLVFSLTAREPRHLRLGKAAVPA